jgi:hypothetical protein
VAVHGRVQGLDGEHWQVGDTSSRRRGAVEGQAHAQCCSQSHAQRDVEAEVAAIVREARWRHEKLYNKAMLLYCVLASEEDRAAMAEPIGWQPVLDTDVSMEEHMHIL